MDQPVTGVGGGQWKIEYPGSANIIVHHLLGDAFATSLEQLVQFAAGQLLGKEYVWDQIRSTPGASGPDTVLISSEQIMGPKHSIRLRLSA